MGPKDIRFQDAPDPKCGPGDVILDVKACAICGTDMRIYNHGHHSVKPGAITGHEIGATILEVGENVEGYEVGQNVIVVTPIGCGRCKYCRKGAHNLCVEFTAIGYEYQGGFAEKTPIPEKAVRQGNLLPMPDGLRFDHATLVEPLSCCVNGQEYLNIQIGDVVVVFGAGPIGAMHVLLAKARGAGKVIWVELLKSKLELATSRIDVDVAIIGEEEDVDARIMEETDGAGADVCITACPAGAAQEQALRLTAKQGRVSLFGGLPKDRSVIKFDSNIVHYKEISVFGAFASHANQYMQAMALIATGAVDAEKLITSRWALNQIPEAIESAGTGKELKMVVEPGRTA